MILQVTIVCNYDVLILIIDYSPNRVAIAKTIERERKEKDAKEEKFVWEKLTQVLPDHTFRIWRV